MSAFVIYINLPRYLGEWARHKFGDQVVFPRASPQNAIIRAYTSKLPKGAVPDAAAPGLTAVAIPDSVAKPPEVYNYMGERGKAAVAESIKDLFLRELWADMTPLRESAVGLTSLIAAWCEANGISIDNVEAVRQCYYRIRKEFARSDINLRNFTRKK